MKDLNSYQRTAITTVFATLFLILVGGLVRAAGAGLGCPDWPTCFGLWIPPLSSEGLPQGFDPALFNPVHTWLEYINRLTGVIIGLLITATFLLSFRYRKSEPIITWCSGAAFVLVLFQGWLGGVVVRSGLEAGMITLHMMLAMVIVNILLFAAFYASREKFQIELDPSIRSKLLMTAAILFILTLIQMVLGTQVRELVDIVKNASEPLPREMWAEAIDVWLYRIHRSFSWLVVIASGVLTVQIRSKQVPSRLRWIGSGILLLVLLQLVLGVGLEWFSMPGLLQLFHLVSATLLLCMEFVFLLLIGFPGGGGKGVPEMG
ncbi:MAG: COX15/CtaA family protein [Balneolaceae bacterium]